MRATRVLSTINTHTGGEPTCIITGGISAIPGKTMQEKMVYMREHEDRLRTAVCLEPRGGVCCGVILTEPCTPGADFGVLHFSTSMWMPMCGHNTIGIAAAMVEAGMVPVREAVTEMTMDTPAGLVRVEVEVKDGRAGRVTMLNAPAFVLMTDYRLETTQYGTLTCDISYGGNIGVLVVAKDVGLALVPERAKEISAAGLSILNDVNRQMTFDHPLLPVHSAHHVQFFSESPTPGVTERIAVVNAVGNIDRSPCGTGTSAKLAVRHKKGELKTGERFVHESLIGSLFYCRVTEEVTLEDGTKAVIPEITGTAYLTGMGQLLIDDADPLTYGFRLS